MLNARPAIDLLIRYRVCFIGGLAALALGALIGLGAQPATLPPSTEPGLATFSIGFVSPVKPVAGRGYLVDVAIGQPRQRWGPRGLGFCSRSSDVLVVVQGSREFWADHAKELNGDVTVGLGITGVRVTRVRETGQESPMAARIDLPALDVFRRTGFAPVDGPDLPVEFQQEVRAPASVATITAKISRWGQDRSPIVFAFRSSDVASWRNFSSCWNRLPALTAAQATFAASWAARAIGRPDAPTVDEFTAGTFPILMPATTARVALSNPAGTDILLAQPENTTTTSLGPVWTCDDFDYRKARLGSSDEITVTGIGVASKRSRDRRSPSLTVDSFRSSAAESDCGGVAGMSRGGRWVLPDEILTFVAGVFVSLGLGLLLLPFGLARRTT